MTCPPPQATKLSHFQRLTTFCFQGKCPSSDKQARQVRSIHITKPAISNKQNEVQYIPQSE